MEQVKINLWSPHPKQREIINSKARYKVVVAGRRFGKTITAVCTLIKKALLKPNSTYFYIAPFYRQGKMIAWKILADKVRTLPGELVISTNETELTVKFSNGSFIAIKGADTPDSLRGIGLDGVVLDEYADMRPNVWEEIIRPSLTDKKGWAMFISTPKGFNSFYDLYNKAKSLVDWEAFHFTSYDNPFIDKEELDSARREMTEDKFMQEFMADFRKYEGVVYREFDRNRHVYNDGEKNINKKEEIVCIDWGFTNPTAMLRVFIDNDDIYYFEDEYYQTGRTTEEVIEYLRTWAPNYVYPDPAEPDRNKLLSNAGFYVRDVNKDIKAGIDKVRELFRNNKIRINGRCKNFIRELESYQYSDTSTKELPIKENDHTCDAARYGLFMHQPKAIRYDNLLFQEDYLYKDIGL